jgi:hypothetical protein
MESSLVELRKILRRTVRAARRQLTAPDAPPPVCA